MTDTTTPTEAPKHSTIPLAPVESKKIHSYGYAAERRVFCVRFKGFKDNEAGKYVYEYPNVSPDTMAELDKAESKGNFINSTFVKTKYPFEKLLAAPAESA